MLLCVAKIWTLLSSNECPLSFACSWMTKSWPEELALHLYSGCLVSPMNWSIDSSVQWTTWPTLIYVGVFCPLGGTVSVCVAKTYSKSNPGAFIGQLSGNNGQLSISQLYWECISIAPDKTKSIETHKWRWHEDSCWQSKIKEETQGFQCYLGWTFYLWWS